MRYGFVWDIAPRHYNQSVDDPLNAPSRPLRQRADPHPQRIRGPALPRADFNDTMGATVHGGPNVRYSVFKPCSRVKSAEACVVVNFDKTPQTRCRELDGSSEEWRLQRRSMPTAPQPYRFGFTIPPHRLAVVVKQ